jgi:repressor LexA
MNGLTHRQEEILEFVAQFIQREGHPPTLKEIGRHFGFTSDNAVRSHLRLIERKGFIKRVPNRARSIVPIDIIRVSTTNGRSLPLVGSISAGKPITALENLEKYITVDKELFKGDDIFALRVKGDSMTGVGINEGDIVIVHPQNYVENGEIAVALIGEEATLKFFYREGEKIILKAANPLYQDIVIETGIEDSGIKILGKVIGLIRKL